MAVFALDACHYCQTGIVVADVIPLACLRMGREGPAEAQSHIIESAVYRFRFGIVTQGMALDTTFRIMAADDPVNAQFKYGPSG
jgi:hypothetical protein